MTRMSKLLIATGLARDIDGAQKIFISISIACLLATTVLTLYALNMDKLSRGGTGLFPDTEANLKAYAEKNNLYVKNK